MDAKQLLHPVKKVESSRVVLLLKQSQTLLIQAGSSNFGILQFLKKISFFLISLFPISASCQQPDSSLEDILLGLITDNLYFLGFH